MMESRSRAGGGEDVRADALVVGAGLIGAAAALGLAAAGLRVGWVAARAAGGAPARAGQAAGLRPAAAGPMAASPPALAASTPADDRPGAAWDSRIYAVSPGSIDWLTQVGAWAGVDAARTCDVAAMQVSGDDGAAQIAFDSHSARRSRLAAICESSNLAQGIERALGRHGERVARIDARVAGLRVGSRSASLVLDSGATLRAPLVVAADGADSSIREWAGIAVRRHDYGHTAVVANFHAAQPHQGIARQWFFGDAVLALLPLPGDHRSLVWSCADAHASFLLGLAPAALAEEVGRVTARETGSLVPVAPARGFALRLQQVDRLVVPRVALVGDAAHAVHPLAGQGMNLGFGDCRELARVLAARGPQPDVGDLALLRRYQRARAEPIARMRLATDGLFRLFASDLPGLAQLRNLGIGWVDRLPLLKRELIAAAID